MNRSKGFTLVEASVAIAAVAILSSIVVPLSLRHIRASQIARAKNDLQVIAGTIAAQLRDLGSRPVAAGGPGGATGAGHAVWTSAGELPVMFAPPAPGGGPAAVPAFPNHVAGNTLDKLFAAPAADAPGGPWTANQANALFGYTPRLPSVEPGYKGPYLGTELADMRDPWGSAYVILGYNQHGQNTHGPIWVVSAGPRKSINIGNVTPGAGAANHYPSHWDFGGGSETNLVVRSN